jgi:hypothetical protein
VPFLLPALLTWVICVPLYIESSVCAIVSRKVAKTYQFWLP